MDPIVGWGLVVVTIALICALLMLENRVAGLEAELRELEELLGYREVKR